MQWPHGRKETIGGGGGGGEMNNIPDHNHDDEKFKIDQTLDKQIRQFKLYYSLCLVIWLRFLFLGCYVIHVLFGCEVLFFIGL